MFGAVSNGENHFALLPEQWGPFLRLHAAATLVCYGAAESHWLLFDWFKSRNDVELLAVLWGFSRQYRLLDVGLLDQELRRVQEDGFARSITPLSRLVEIRTATQLPNKDNFRQQIGVEVLKGIDEFSLSRLRLPITVARILLKIHNKLQESVDQLPSAMRSRSVPPIGDLPDVPVLPQDKSQPEERNNSRVHVKLQPIHFAPADLRCGPLAVGIDVCGSIAAASAARNRLEPSRDAIQAALTTCQDVVLHACHHLRKVGYIAKQFKWQGGLVETSASGEPLGIEGALKAAIERKRNDLVDRMSLPARLPDVKGNSPAAVVERFGIWADVDDDLHALSDLVLGSESLVWLRSANAEASRAAPNATKRSRTKRPNLAFLHRLGVPVLQARNGHRILVVDLPDLRLRCFAAACRFWFHHLVCSLYGLFESHPEPMVRVGEQLREGARRYARQKWGHAWEKFEPHDQPDWWRQAATRLLEFLTFGLPMSEIRNPRRFGFTPSLDQSDWEYLVRVLSFDCVTELRNILGKDAGDAVAGKLSGPTETTREKAGFGPWRNLHNQDFRHRANLHTWTQMRSVSAESFLNTIGVAPSTLDQVLPGNEATELLKISLLLPGQRRTCRWYPADVYSQAVDTLMADVVKLVAHSLVADGVCLVGMTPTSLLLEVEDRQPRTNIEEQVKTICKDAGTMVLGAAAAAAAPLSWSDFWPAGDV